MKNAFNSSNELWTEFVASGGIVGVMADVTAGALSAGDKNKAQEIETFAGANSYLRPRHLRTIVWLVEKYLTAWPGSTSD